MKGPFEAAKERTGMDRLTGIDWVISALKAVRGLNDGYEAHQTWIDDAIRVLEAAGKVDKAELMVYLNHAIDWKENDPYGPGSAEEDRKLRTFIESLPEPEEKRK